jgi:hypothetical protein|tara:strand:+ start:2039 stop:2176 length:138 start_codon:yes stop_codon:yes gene_type:complete
MKKRKLNSKNPKYIPESDKKTEKTTKKLIASKGKVKVYAIFKENH